MKKKSQTALQVTEHYQVITLSFQGLKINIEKSRKGYFFLSDICMSAKRMLVVGNRNTIRGKNWKHE